MLKLNNRGWGLSVMLASLTLLLGALLVVVIMSNKFNYMLENTNSSGGYTSGSNTILDDSISNNKNINNVDNNSLYYNYEEIIKHNSTIYKENSYPNINEGERFYININNLDISSEIKNNCSGYVVITKDNSKPFIKCGNYQSKGYLSELDY